jgi:hypothetical protein
VKTPLSIRGNKLLLQTKVVPRAIRPLWMIAFFIFEEVICMDSDYYYYYFDDCNLINYTNYLGENRNGKEII